jgi:hypothetical protein
LHSALFRAQSSHDADDATADDFTAAAAATAADDER